MYIFVKTWAIKHIFSVAFNKKFLKIYIQIYMVIYTQRELLKCMINISSYVYAYVCMYIYICKYLLIFNMINRSLA